MEQTLTTELSKEQIDFYQENGFIQINDVLTAEELEELRMYIEESMQEHDGKSLATGKDRGAYYRVLNQKVNTWRDHGGMARYVMHKKLATLAMELSGSKGIRIFHDHALWKMPEDSRPTPWHQDFVYWPLHEPGPLSIWIALDDVDENNGCMKFVPGSHKVGSLKAVDLTSTQTLEELAEGTNVEGQTPVICRMKAGSCTFHNGLTFHYAHANNTDKPRRALAIIYIPDGTRYNGKPHVVTDGVGLVKDEPVQGGLFPLLAHV